MKILTLNRKPKAKPQGNYTGQNHGFAQKRKNSLLHVMVPGGTICHLHDENKKNLSFWYKKIPVGAEMCPRCASGTGQFYKKEPWLSLSAATFARYGSGCMKCGSKTDTRATHVKTPTHYPDLKADPENLQVLCFECNVAKGCDDHTDYRPQGSKQ